MKRSTITMAMVLMAALFCGIAAAQEQKPAGETPVEMGAPAEMKQVDFMIGIWDVTIQYRMSPEAEWMQATATNTNNMILDGCVLESMFEGQMGGMPMQGISMTTYNRGLKMWQEMWTDNFGMGISLYTGGFADGKWIFAGADVSADGDTILSRVTSYNITDTKYDWMMENSTDNGQTWFTSMEMTYTKRQ
jgi:hypothetical protein